MEVEADGLACLRIEFGGAVTAIFQEFGARQRGAKADVERTPVAGLVQSGAQALDGVAEETDGRHPGQQAALPQDQV